MKVKCDYCENYFDDELSNCPFCGGTNNHIRRGSDDVPKTIEELKEFCTKNNIPAENLKFHIGEDFKGPKAFGIYVNNNGDFVVYKNKVDGSRAIRYEGKDEAYAVNELYLKLKEIIIISKKEKKDGIQHIESNDELDKKKQWKNCFTTIGKIYLGIFSFLFIIVFIFLLLSPKNGYYEYDDQILYYQNSIWYTWDDYDSSWHPDYNLDIKPSGDNFKGEDYLTYDVGDFSDSSWYNYSSSNWDSDWDSFDNDYDFDYDYDWGSDW